MLWLCVHHSMALSLFSSPQLLSLQWMILLRLRPSSRDLDVRAHGVECMTVVMHGIATFPLFVSTPPTLSRSLSLSLSLSLSPPPLLRFLPTPESPPLFL